MTLYIHDFRCKACGNRFSVRRKSEAVPQHAQCPRKACGSKRVRESHMQDVGFDPAEGKSPALGGSIHAKALDYSMKIAAEDAGLTNLNDSARYGEPMAPKLPPRLQTQADGFFGGGKVAGHGRRRVQVDLRGAMGALAQGGAPAAQNPGFSVDVGSLLPKGRSGGSAVPTYTAVASD